MPATVRNTAERSGRTRPTLEICLNGIMGAKDINDVANSIALYDGRKAFQIVHIGLCKLDNIPVKDIILARPIVANGMSTHDFSDELKWAVCREVEFLMRPFDLAAHKFTQCDDDVFNGLRQAFSKGGVKQVIIIPLQIKNTISVVILNFPNADYAENAQSVLPDIYQIMSALFNRFPTLLKWSDESRLTRRETQILQLTAEGLTEAAIASGLEISVNTVRNHVENCKDKLNARNKVHAVMIAVGDNEINPI